MDGEKKNEEQKLLFGVIAALNLITTNGMRQN
jgi:hypothetical protein